MAGIDGRTISMPRISRCKPANKGHFVVYSNDMGRFVIPLKYLQTNIFRELFHISLKLTAFLEYVVYSIQKDVGKNTHKALFLSLVSSNCLAAASDHRLSPYPIIGIQGFCCL